MNHLLVVAHPLENSVTMKLAAAYADELAAAGHECVLQDLYRLKFDPVLSADELEPRQSIIELPEAVRVAQAAVMTADVLAVIYPLWWATMPAILKGYIDRVFARGFAYVGEGGVTRPLLRGKSCVLITLSGSPSAQLQASGEWSAIRALQDKHIFLSSGFALLEHLHFEAVEPPTPEDVLKKHEERVRACVRQHFVSNEFA